MSTEASANAAATKFKFGATVCVCAGAQHHQFHFNRLDNVMRCNTISVFGIAFHSVRVPICILLSCTHTTHWYNSDSSSNPRMSAKQTNQPYYRWRHFIIQMQRFVASDIYYFSMHFFPLPFLDIYFTVCDRIIRHYYLLKLKSTRLKFSYLISLLSIKQQNVELMKKKKN